jgi:hypothetical protein
MEYTWKKVDFFLINYQGEQTSSVVWIKIKKQKAKLWSLESGQSG